MAVRVAGHGTGSHISRLINCFPLFLLPTPETQQPESSIREPFSPINKPIPPTICRKMPQNTANYNHNKDTFYPV
jgi:hypothetical protein